jgi:hypothetical protein
MSIDHFGIGLAAGCEFKDARLPKIDLVERASCHIARHIPSMAPSDLGGADEENIGLTCH